MLELSLILKVNCGYGIFMPYSLKAKLIVSVTLDFIWKYSQLLFIQNLKLKSIELSLKSVTKTLGSGDFNINGKLLTILT